MQVWHPDRYSKYAKYGNQRVKSVPSEGSHAEGIGGSIRTRHSALSEVVDHSRCRKVFTVQSHEWSLGRRRLYVPRAITSKKKSAAWTSSHEIVLQKPNRRTPGASSQADEGYGGTCSPVAPSARSRACLPGYYAHAHASARPAAAAHARACGTPVSFSQLLN
jgi:hypothetical protein